MPKITCGIGFGVPEETSPGIWEDKITQKQYRAELIRNSKRLQSADKVNSDITLTNELSIIADPYAKLNFHAIRYAEFMGSKWEVTSVSVEYPRLNLTLGGVYNGPQT